MNMCYFLFAFYREKNEKMLQRLQCFHWKEIVFWHSELIARVKEALLM